MSWKASGYVKQIVLCPNGEGITRSEKLLALVIADYYNEEEGRAWASVATLARDAIMSQRQIRYVLRSLEKKGLISTTTGGVNKSNSYRFPPLGEATVAPPATLAPPAMVAPPARATAGGTATASAGGTAIAIAAKPIINRKKNREEERSGPHGPETGSACPRQTKPKLELFSGEGWSELGWLKEFLQGQESVENFPIRYFGDDRWWRNVSKQVNGISASTVTKTFAFMGSYFLENSARRPVTKRGWMQTVRNLLVKQVEMDNQVKRRNGDGLDPDSLKERLLKKLEETT
jgi:hypothetical protein